MLLQHLLMTVEVEETFSSISCQNPEYSSS